MKRFLLLVALVSNLSTSHAQFVKVNDVEFTLDGRPYRFIGTNLWYGMHLGSPGEGGDRSRLIKELDKLQELGLTNLRIMASSEGGGDAPYQNTPTLQTAPGQYDNDLLAGLDFFLAEMGKRNMKAVVCLGNFWMWSGGFPQYISWANGSDIPYPEIEKGGTWDPFIQYSLSFFRNKKAIEMYMSHVKTIVTRVNSITGLAYTEDPTIMAWQLANEPRGYDDPKAYRKWIKKSARLIKSLDKNHLVCLGSEGNTSNPNAGVDIIKDNKSKHIDYATTHVWIQNWGWYDPLKPESFESALKKSDRYIEKQLAKAKKLKKPVVVEEFGVSRDRAQFDLEASVEYRNVYYRHMFGLVSDNISANGPIQGCNFWSWGGYGVPNNPGKMWKVGDSLIGDPAHELQGWYSVFIGDDSTLEIIKNSVESIKDNSAKNQKVGQVIR